MRFTLILLGAMLLTGCEKPAAQQGNAPQANAEAELRAANAGYDKALIDGDAAALARFYTDDFRIIDDDAAVHDKRNQIQFMTQQIDLLHARSDDVRVEMLGPDAALLTGQFTGRYRMNDKENDFTERYTSVWVRDGNDWRVKHEHASLKPAAPEQRAE